MLSTDLGEAMRRRDFIAALGSAAVAWPMKLHAQQIPVIGILNSRGFDKNGPLVNAFRRGLAENGYTEGRNVAIEYRSADGDYTRLPALAAELARQPVDVLVSFGASRQRSRPRARPPRFRPSRPSALIPSGSGWQRARTGRAATAPAYFRQD
jgi:hypothetical protein